MSTSSTIRVFVQWKEPMVFAGENVECTITFKNVTPVPGSARPEQASSTLNGFTSAGERQRKTVPPRASAASTRQGSAQSSRAQSRAPSPSNRGHRPNLSLNVPTGSGSPRTLGSPWAPSPTTHEDSSAPSQKHKRSVSIISGGGNGGDAALSVASPPTSRRPTRSHGRSASLQVVPQRSIGLNGGLSSPRHGGTRSATQPSPLYHTSAISETSASLPPMLTSQRSRRSSSIAPTSNPGFVSKQPRKPSGSFSQDFKFPSAAPLADVTRQPDGAASLDPNIPSSRRLSPRPQDDTSASSDHLAPATRLLSGSSLNGGTPRSSGDFYSMSNNSTETLASDYVTQTSSRLLPRPGHSRMLSHVAMSNSQKKPETLMMGYAQIMGSFTLDGSLINQAPFEGVKRKAVVGGQGGGGVVGVEKNKRDSGILGALGWGNIGDSIGGLLGGGELSSIKEMRGIANSRVIPLLSTPQSILFVDLRLAPGESKTFTYSFTMPQGLPPTHKGKAIKISYNLVIGTQRPTTAKGQQQVKHVDIPFRLLGSVNSRGELLGHDLMSPYVLLRDEARTSTVAQEPSTPISSLTSLSKPAPTGPASSLDDFLSYVGRLIEDPRRDSSTFLLSPSETPRQRHSSAWEDQQTSPKEAIDLAILRSNISDSGSGSNNRYNIARNGQRVATLVLARAAYRLGETITAVIDFTDADIPCYAVHALLESSETVDPAIALRSGASIYRATRKTHASRSESTLFARRVIFSPTIAVTASPEFITSSVNLEWKLRVEFITPRISGEEEDEGGGQQLLEAVSADERGLILAATEGLVCESFEVAVPLRVYGAISSGVRRDEATGTQGLVV